MRLRPSFVVTSAALLLVACAAGPVPRAVAPASAPTQDSIAATYPEDQAAVAKRVEEIIDAAQKKDLDRLESYHSYGPKFSKFDDDPLDRQDADAGKKGERDAFSALTSFRAKAEALRVDVFGPTAVATFYLAYEAQMGPTPMTGKDRATLVFEKENGSWKIVHEHLSAYKTAK